MLFVNTRNSGKSLELLSEVVNKRSNNVDCRRALCLHFIFSQFVPMLLKYLTNYNICKNLEAMKEKEVGGGINDKRALVPLGSPC